MNESGLFFLQYNNTFYNIILFITIINDNFSRPKSR